MLKTQTVHAQRGEQNQTEALKLWVMLSRAQAAIGQHLHVQVTRHGLTPTEFGVLEILYHKGPLLLGDVQRKLLVSSGGITYLVDRLEEKKFVERHACAEDRRATYAKLTRQGEELVRRVFPEHARCLEHAMSGLTLSEKRRAVRLLRTLGLRAAVLPKCEPDA